MNKHGSTLKSFSLFCICRFEQKKPIKVINAYAILSLSTELVVSIKKIDGVTYEKRGATGFLLNIDNEIKLVKTSNTPVSVVGGSTVKRARVIRMLSVLAELNQPERLCCSLVNIVHYVRNGGNFNMVKTMIKNDITE